MKIKILKKNETTLGEWIGGAIWLGCTPEECGHCLDQEIETFLKIGCPDCITKCVDEGEPFFCSIMHMQGKHAIVSNNNPAHAIARLVHHDEGCRLFIDRFLGPQLANHADGDKFVIGAYQPQNISYIPHIGPSIMTSDGLICLEEDQYIGVRDGEIVELSATVLLEQLGKYRAATSPRYGAVEVTPTKTRPSRPRSGTIIHNEVTGKLEVFLGGQWKSLKLEE